MKLETSKSKHIQYQIAEYIQNSLRENNYLANATLVEVCYAVFDNFRISNDIPKGLRLSTMGNRYMSKHFESFGFDLQEPLIGVVLINLDKAMTRPYYLTKKKVVLYDENDAAWFRLGGNDLKYFSGNL